MKVVNDGKQAQQCADAETRQKAAVLQSGRDGRLPDAPKPVSSLCPASVPLRCSKAIRDIVDKLFAKHNVRMEVGAHLRLEKPSYMPLVVEFLAKDRASVAHYHEQEGDLIADPDVVFWIGPDGEWYPIEIQQPSISLFGADLGGYKVYAQLTDDGQIEVLNQRMQADLASFCNTWAKNIKAQGWLERGQLPASRLHDGQPCAMLPDDTLAASVASTVADTDWRDLLPVETAAPPFMQLTLF
ncbi:MAG: hypothetical protein JW850_04580 [Thermoflexales bacterium]|nr:hypothetical protein [Thermoflexales bacterium]